MNGMKRDVALIIALLMLACLGGCGIQAETPSITATSSVVTPAPTYSTAPIPTASSSPFHTTIIITPDSTAEVTEEPIETEEPEEPEETEEPEPIPDYDIQGMKEAGMSNTDYYKINALLYGLTCLSKDKIDNAKKTTKHDMIYFAWEILDDCFDVIGYDQKESYTKAEVEKIINSAFGVRYSAKNGDGRYIEEIVRLECKNGVFLFEAGEGDPYWVPHAYSITRISSNRICVRFNAFKEGGGLDIRSFERKIKVILQEDNKSLFGYHLVSFSSIDTNPAFNTATASSSLAKSGKVSYLPENCIDKKLSTGWASKKNKGEWLKISSSKTQTITGISVYINDRNRKEDDYQDFVMTTVQLEFSDGTIMEWDIQSASYPDDDFSIAFSREIKTKYIKIRIISTEEDVVYIAEVKPF